MDNRVPLRFFIITFSWSWLIWLPLILAGFDVIPVPEELLRSVTIPISIIAAFGPAAGAFISLRTLNGKGAVKRYLHSFLSLKFGWKVWMAIVLVLSSTTLAAWYIPELFGEPRLPMLLPGIYVFPLYWVMMVFLGGGQEEIGWRGYILPFLERRFGTWTGSTILGLIWAVWHIPLWFIPGTSQVYMHFVGFTMLILGYSYFYSWVMRASGGRPLASLIAHGTANALVPVFPVLIMKLNVPQPRFWLWTSLTLIAGISVLLLSRHPSGAEL